MDTFAKSLSELLRGIPTEQVVVLGVGNEFAGDDAFGKAVVDGLGMDLAARVVYGSNVPENELPGIARLSPKLVLIVDAVDFKARPGTLRIVRPDDLTQDGIDTHAPSLALAAKFLEESCGTQCRVIAAQPKHTGPHAGMSEEILHASRKTAELLRNLLGTRG